ncbi:ER membrane protein complex subunit 6-like [Symsagittifera roscoffensis]|uniref:ER membrane protein complex subunit 6-like n=1 Tax=Symsagittifera roscoffensis TaxID=84072 RepID=UPI00307C4DFB
MEASAAPLEENKPVYSPVAIQHNMAVLEYCRTCGASLGGAAAGIIGLTGIQGFLFVLFVLLATNTCIFIKAGLGQSHKYFISSKSVVTSSIFSFLFTYVLFWTFFYGIVHVY